MYMKPLRSRTRINLGLVHAHGEYSQSCVSAYAVPDGVCVSIAPASGGLCQQLWQGVPIGAHQTHVPF